MVQPRPTGGVAGHHGGVEPQAHVSVHAPRLLTGTAAEPALDHAMPRPMSAVPDPALVVAIDCEVPGAVRWQLEAGEFDDVMCGEIRDRVRDLVTSLGLPATNP